MCYVLAVKLLPILHLSADYTFFSFGITELNLVVLEIK